MQILMCHMQASLDSFYELSTQFSLPVTIPGCSLFVLIESAFYFFKWRIFPSGILTLHLHFLCVLQEILTGWGMTSPRMLAQALLSTKQTWGTTRASLSNSRMCLRGTGTRPTPEACSPPSSPTAPASSDSDSPQAKLPRAAQVGRTPRVCSLKEQTYGTSCVSHLYVYRYVYKNKDLRREKQFNMSFLGEKHTQKYSRNDM